MLILLALTGCGFEPSTGLWAGSFPSFYRSDGWGSDDCEAERILGYNSDWTVQYELSIPGTDATRIQLTEQDGVGFTFTCEQTANHANFYSCDYYESNWDLAQYSSRFDELDVGITWFNTMGLKFKDSDSVAVEYQLYATCTGMQCEDAADVVQTEGLSDSIPLGLLEEQNCESTPFFDLFLQ